MTLSQRRAVHLMASTLLLGESLLTPAVSFASTGIATARSASVATFGLRHPAAHLFSLSASTQAYDIEGYNYYCTNGGTACAANANGSVRNCLSSGISCSGLNYADAEAYGPPDGSAAGTPDAMVIECTHFTATGYEDAAVSVYSPTGQSTYQGIEKDLGTISGKGTLVGGGGAEDNLSQVSSINASALDPHSGVNGGGDTATVSGTQNTDNSTDSLNSGSFSITIKGEIDTYNTNGVFQSSSTGTISCTAGGTHANDLYDAGLDTPYFEGELEWVNNAAGVTAWNDVPLGRSGGFRLDLNALDAGLVATVPLFDLPGVNGFDANLALVYSSYASSGAGSPGYGWMLVPADMHLSIGSSAVTLVDPTGATWTFADPTPCSFTPPPGIDAVLGCANGGYTLTFNASGQVDTFDANGYLLSMANRAGNTITFTRDSNHLVTSIETTEGQTIGLTYTNSLLTMITEPGGETWTLGQDSSGDLTSLTDPTGAVMKFAYVLSEASPGDQKPTYHDLTKITDADGNATSIAYDGGQGGEITSITNAAGKTWSIDPGSITDPNGHTTTYGFDSQNRINSVTYADNSTASQTWTSDNHLASITKPSGATTTFSYDTKNNLTGVTLPTGATESWQYANSSLPYLPTSFTDAQGNATSYNYTTQGLLWTVTDPDNKIQTYTYNTNGTLASSTDPNGHQTSYSYFAGGLLQQETPPSPLGSISFTYTPDDLENTVTDGNGKLTQFTYSKRGELTGVGYADGTAVGYSYDPAGNLLGMTGNSGSTEYHYNNLNQVISEVLPNASTACTDSLGNPASICYTYDPVGNLLSETDGSGTVSYTYSPVNQVASVTDPFGTTTIGYDTDHNRNSIAFPNGVTETMTYNGAGQLLTITGTKGSQTLTSDSYSYVNPQTQRSTLLR